MKKNEQIVSKAKRSRNGIAFVLTALLLATSFVPLYVLAAPINSAAQPPEEVTEEIPAETPEIAPGTPEDLPDTPEDLPGTEGETPEGIPGEVPDSVTGDAIAASSSALEEIEPLEEEILPLAAGEAEVSTWADFITAWRDQAIYKITLTADITHPTLPTATQPNDRPSNGYANALGRPLEIVGGGYTMDFGSDVHRDNSLTLRGVSASSTLKVSNLMVKRSASADRDRCVHLQQYEYLVVPR